MKQKPQDRPLHDMGGATGPGDSARHKPPNEGDGPERRPSPIGKGGTPNVAGSAEQQPEIAEGPVPGVQPGEQYARPGHRPPIAMDPPTGTAVPRDAAGDTDAVRRWQHAGELSPLARHFDPEEPLEQQPDPQRTGHDPGAAPEDEGIPDLQDDSPEREWSEDPQRQAVPGDVPVAAESFGTTGAEQAQGESLADRLAQEEPEVDERTAVAGPPDEAAGRLTLTDPHSDFRADAPGDDAGLSAEEEAVRIRHQRPAGAGA